MGRLSRRPTVVRRTGVTLRIVGDRGIAPDGTEHPLCEAHDLLWAGPAGVTPEVDPPRRTQVVGRTARFTLDQSAEGHILDVMENLLDPLHTHYVHPGLVRREARRRPVTARVEPFPGGVQARYLGEEQQKGLIAEWFGAGVSTSLGRYLYPASAELVYLDRDGAPILVASADFIQVEPHVVRSFATVVGSPGVWPRWLAIAVMRSLFTRVVAQDAAIVARQAAGRRVFPEAGDVSTEADVLRPSMQRFFREGPGASPRPREVVLWI